MQNTYEIKHNSRRTDPRRLNRKVQNELVGSKLLLRVGRRVSFLLPFMTKKQGFLVNQ